MTLGQRIAERRRALGWSQNELARRAQVNHPTLYKIETGQRVNPTIGIVVQIAHALGTSAEALLGYEREEVRLLVDHAGAEIAIELRALTEGRGEAKARDKARTLVTGALERAGARVRDVTAAKGEDAEASPKREAGRLAVGGLALVEELQAVRRRLDALETWRHGQEARPRRRASQ